jgi:hypothetical protein
MTTCAAVTGAGRDDQGIVPPPPCVLAGLTPESLPEPLPARSALRGRLASESLSVDA